MNQDQKLIQEMEEDIADNERAVKGAEDELDNAKKWLEGRKLCLAESIIKLYNYKKSND